MSEFLEKIINSKSKTFLAFCFCFISGVATFSFVGSGNILFYLYVSLFFILFLLIIFWQQIYKRFFILCLLFFVLGACRFLLVVPESSLSRIEYYNGNKVSLQGWVSAEPDIGISDAHYVVNVVCKGSPCEKVSGKVIIKTRLYPQYQYGEEIKISCLLAQPENFSDSNFNYQKYLAKQGIWSACLSPTIISLGSSRGNFLLKVMFWLKSKVQSQMSNLWPEPQNSLMAGVLYGSRSSMPQDLVDNFTRTGVSHIIAVSGYNVSIIVVMLNVCLIYVGLSRRKSFWFLNFLILAFVFFSGATASVVRAGVMAAIVLFAQHMGRLSSAGRTLVYAAVLMLLFNPYVLIWDVGFQLSFLSTVGLVYLSPILESMVFKKSSRVSMDATRHDFVKSKTKSFPWLVPLLEILITTMSAIISTLPLILFQFGRLSLVAPLVNVLILWLVPWLMLAGFVSLIFSWLFFPLGQALAWVAGLGLNYVIIIVDWFGSKSWSAVNIQIPVWSMLAAYLILGYIIVKYEKS